MHYLAEVRLLEARRILCDGLFRTQDVALAVGYENRSSFVRAFSKRFGYPPGQCRPEMLSGRSATSEFTESNTTALGLSREGDL
jgi:AraC-like DNA-binding protein